MEFVYQFLINAKPLTIMELVYHAMLDTILEMELVNLPPLKSLLIKDVELGTGKIKNVSDVQTIGFSTTSENVFQFLTNAKLSMPQELVNHATKDITWSMELANLLPLKNPLISDVVNGIGTTKFVLLVLADLSSTVPENVFPSMITVKNGTAMEIVPTVMLDTFSMEEFALKVMLFVRTLMPMELVPLATQDTF